MADVYKKYNQKVVLAMINNLDTKKIIDTDYCAGVAT